MCCYICRINKKNWYDSIICIGSGAVLYLENRSGLEIFDRFSKLSTDGGSGRDVIWAITLQAFNVSNLREKIWGHGFQSVYYRLRPGGFSRFSHNSYIEYLYDYGIIISIIRFIFNYYRNKVYTRKK